MRRRNTPRHGRIPTKVHGPWRQVQLLRWNLLLFMRDWSLRPSLRPRVMNQEQLSRFPPVFGSLEMSEAALPPRASGEFTGETRAEPLDSGKPLPVVGCNSNQHVGVDQISAPASIQGVCLSSEQENSVGQSLPGLAAQLVRAQSSQTEQLSEREQSLERIKVHNFPMYIYTCIFTYSYTYSSYFTIVKKYGSTSS